MGWRGILEGVCLVRWERQRCVFDQHKKFDPRWVVMEERFSPPPPPPAAMRSRPTELVSGSLGSPPCPPPRPPPHSHTTVNMCVQCVSTCLDARVPISGLELSAPKTSVYGRWHDQQPGARLQNIDSQLGASCRGGGGGGRGGRRGGHAEVIPLFFFPPSFFLYVFLFWFAREKHFPVKYTTLAQTNTPAVPKHGVRTLSQPTRVGLHCTRTDCRCLCTIAQSHNSVWTT